MVVVSFRRDGFEKLRLRVQPGEPVSWDGDISIVDFDAQPFSALYGGPVSFHTDAVEWAHATAEAYSGGRQLAEVIIEQVSDPAAPPAAAEPPVDEDEDDDAAVIVPTRPMALARSVALDEGEEDELLVLRPGQSARPRPQRDPDPRQDARPRRGRRGGLLSAVGLQARDQAAPAPAAGVEGSTGDAPAPAPAPAAVELDLVAPAPAAADPVVMQAPSPMKTVVVSRPSDTPVRVSRSERKEAAQREKAAKRERVQREKDAKRQAKAERRKADAQDGASGQESGGGLLSAIGLRRAPQAEAASSGETIQMSAPDANASPIAMDAPMPIVAPMPAGDGSGDETGGDGKRRSWRQRLGRADKASAPTTDDVVEEEPIVLELVDDRVIDEPAQLPAADEQPQLTAGSWTVDEPESDLELSAPQFTLAPVDDEPEPELSAPQFTLAPLDDEPEDLHPPVFDMPAVRETTLLPPRAAAGDKDDDRPAAITSERSGRRPLLLAATAAAAAALAAIALLGGGSGPDGDQPEIAPVVDAPTLTQPAAEVEIDRRGTDTSAGDGVRLFLDGKAATVDLTGMRSVSLGRSLRNAKRLTLGCSGADGRQIRAVKRALGTLPDTFHFRFKQTVPSSFCALFLGDEPTETMNWRNVAARG